MSVTKNAVMLLGKVAPSTIRKAAFVRVPRKVLDKNLNMYFSEWTTYYAHDPMEKCKPGDVVLIKALPERLSKDVGHEVKEIVFPRGNITDPISRQKSIGTSFVKDINEINVGFGGRNHPVLNIEHSEQDLTPRDNFPTHLDEKLID
ncbi:MRPS17 (predicted) [Pycnogonum litorale]